jgi:hypothetical protein
MGMSLSWLEKMQGQDIAVGKSVQLPGMTPAIGPNTAKLFTGGLTEKQFQALVVSLAKSRGFRVYHTHDSRRSEPGFPDLVIAKPGRMIAAELKVPGGKVSEAQEEWLSLFDSVGLPNAIWYPEQWSEILDTLK